VQGELGTGGAERTTIDEPGLGAQGSLDISAAASSIEPQRLALQLAAAILVLGLLGGLQYVGAPLGAFNLDAEFTVPAFFSTLLLLAAAALALGLASATYEGGRMVAALWVLAGTFAFMSADEVAVMHENWDDWFGLDNWIVGYFPIAAVAVVAWLVLLRRIRAEVARRLWLAGAGAWIAAAILELPTQAGGQIRLYGLLMVSEELLEMAGSACFGLTLLILLQRWRSGASPRHG
jgi:hypothetical protein